MGTTSAALDNTQPPELLEELRQHILAEKASGNPRFANRTHLDQDGCCLIEDLGGPKCPGDTCCLPGHGAKKVKIGPGYVTHKPLDRPIPIPKAAAPAARVASARKKRRPASRKRPAARKAKSGRRRR